MKSNVDKLDIDKLKNAPTNLGNLESKADKLDVDKLGPLFHLVDLSKIRDVVKNDALKKDVYNIKIKNIEYKISNINNLVTYASRNAKGEIPNTTNLATTAALTAVENNIINLVKKN